MSVLAALSSVFRCPPEKDHKSRFFWRIGPAPESNKHRDLNMPQVVPKAFPQWADTMNNWGETILSQTYSTYMSCIFSASFSLYQ